MPNSKQSVEKENGGPSERSSSSNSRHTKPNGDFVDEKKFQLYVSGYPRTYNEDEVKHIFQNYNVKCIKICKRDTFSYAFITLSSPEEVATCIRDMQNLKVEGRNVIVNGAKSNPRHEVATAGAAANITTYSNGSYYGKDSTHQNEYRFGNNTCENHPGTPQLINSDGDDDEMPPLALLEPPAGRMNCLLDKQANTDKDEDTTLNVQHGIAKVLVSSFPPGMSEFEIMSIFSEYHPRRCLILLDVPIPHFNQDTLALVYFGEKQHATMATSNINETTYQNKMIYVWNLL